MTRKGTTGGIRRFLALCLSASMLFADVLPAAAVGGGESSVLDTGVTDEELREALAQEAEVYPDGGFEFFESQLTVEEGGKQQLVIVRRGGRSQEATVDFKAVDVSAAYGEDYLLTVKESDYLSKTLDGEGKPLSDLNTELEITGDEETPGTGQESEEGEEMPEVDGALETDGGKTLQTVSAPGTAKKKSSGSALQAARDTYLGSESSSLNWQELDDAQKAEAEAQSAAYEQAYDAFAGDMYGVSYTFTFQKGEYKKVVEIETIEDELSESDEQVMFLLSNASAGEIAGTSTAYLNITDNDEDEKAIFAMEAGEISVDRSEGTATVVVNRVSGIHKIASVIVGTGSDTAVSGVDYEAVQKEVIFAQGVASQTVKIPLLNYAGAPETAQFRVALDAESSFVQEDHAITTVTLTNREPVAEEPAAAEEEDGQLTADAAAEWSDTKNVSTSASVANKKTAWSGRKRILSDVDLSTAESITVTWKSDEGSYTYQYTTGSGCKKKTHTDTARGRETYLYINGNNVLQRNDVFSQTSQTVNLSDVSKTTNAYLDLEVKTTGENMNATARISKVVIKYPGYQFTVENTEFTDGAYSNVYTEKIYTDDADANLSSNGHRYKLGNKIKIGEIKASKNGSSQLERSVTLHRACDTVTFATTYSTNKNSNNVAVKAGYSGNVYLVGYQLKKPGGQGWSPLINPEDIRFGKAFITNYKGYLHTGREFIVRPVYRPFEARVRFQNGDAKKGGYANGFKTNDVLRCTTLDTIKVRGIANQGYSVKGFNLGVHSDTTIHQAGITPNLLASRANGYYAQSDKTIISEANRVSASKYRKIAVTTAVANASIGNVVTFTPTGEYTYINPEYSVPTVLVKVDPKSNDKDKGAVVYTPQDGTATEGRVLTGDKDHPMKIEGVTQNKEYTINAVTEDNYKAYFKNFTGDADQNGTITTAEEKAVASYNFVRTASNGNTYTFRPVLDLTLIYYGFFPAVVNRYEGTIDGVVALRDKPIFGNQTTLTAINGAQISVAGMTTVSKADAYFGGVNENGGDGYFSLSSRDFVSGENQTVNITYDNIRLTASQAVNAAGLYELDAYDTIGVSQADAYRVEGRNVTKISPHDISNGDKTYRITIHTYSKNDTVAAKKAVYAFYRKDGSQITTKEVTSSNGIFTLDFNPASLGITPGASMSVKFFDQNQVGYFEHDMGFTFSEALGILSFLSSFNFGGAEKAIEIVGVIDSVFDFGWDGDIDKIATNSGDSSTKTISIGYSFSTKKELTEEDKEKKQAVKDAAKGAGTSAEQKKQQKEAADAAVDKGGNGAKKKTEIGASASIEMSFGLEINMGKSTSKEHRGEWYFKDMMLTASAAGGVDVTISYVTPIGIPIRVGISTGVSGSATMIIEQNYSKDEYYFSQVTDTAAGKIDIFDFNMKKGDRAFDAYGIFTVAPYLDLSAGAGFDFLNLMVGGRADFDMNFYTRSDQTNTGNVKFSAYISLKILFFTKKWNLTSTTVNMFGESSSLEEMAGGADYTYESLATMEVDSRAYLKNRSGWMGEKKIQARSVASTSGISEMLLQSGMNPNPDIQMTALSNGKYLAVFLDDNMEEDTYNCTHVYYTVGDGNNWKKPEMIETDGTTDDAPAIFDLGERGVYVAWSSADRKLTEDDTVISSLNSMNIHGAFFNTDAEEFGEIQEITKTDPYHYTDEEGTLIADNVADVEPHISYDPDTDRMLMFYTKIEYESTAEDDEGLVGDVAKPYSLIAYRVYDFTSNTWVNTYETSEGLDEDYTKAWYGQRFLELSPLAEVEEELDGNGYWTKEPVISKYQKASYTGTDGVVYEQDPIILESEVATYNGLALYAYVLDYDGNKETETDRDIFLQIYNYVENSFTHPIMVTTSRSIPESAISFGRSGGTTLLTYVAENTLYALNLSYVVKNRLIRTDVDGRPFYYIDKAAPTGEEGPDDSVYMPPVFVAGEKLEETTGGSSDMEDEGSTGAWEEEPAGAAEEAGAEETSGAIVDYQIASTDNYVYAVWTQQDTRAKEGIEENSEEAQEAGNRVIESQIYVARYDSHEGIITSPVQVTDEEGANYGAIGCAVTESGEVKMLASKAGSTMETVTGADGSEQKVVVKDTENTAMTALTFTPTSTLTVRNLKIEELMAGTDSNVSLELFNDGVETLSGLTFTAKNQDGKVICTEAISEKMYGGRTLPVSFPVTLDADAEEISFTYEVTDANGAVLVSDQYTEEIPLELDITSFEAATDERGTITFTAEVTNNSRRKSGEQRVAISRRMEEVEEDYTEITSFTTENLLPGESDVYTITYDYGSYDDMFATFITEGTEELKAVTWFKASTGAFGEPAETSLEMVATKEQRLRMSAVRKVTILDGSYQEVGESYQMDQGDITQLNTAVESIAYSGSRYQGMDDTANYDKSNTAGLKVMYTTDNPEVLTVYDSGYVEAAGNGTATVTAYVMPSNNRFQYSAEMGTVEEDNYATLPEEAMILESFQVTVANATKPDDPVKPDPVKPNPVKPDPVKPAPVSRGKTYTVNKVKYKVTALASGNKAGTVTYVKDAAKGKKLVVPASVKLPDGKSYAVTAIGIAAFKGNKKATQAVIGKNVKKIAAKAFYGCAKLKKITMKTKKLISVGKKAIYGISKKAVIKVPAAKRKVYKKKFSAKTGFKKTMKIK